MNLHVENPEESKKKLLELINSAKLQVQHQYSKISSVSYTSNKQFKREIKKTIPYKIEFLKKYLAISSTKEEGL